MHENLKEFIKNKTKVVVEDNNGSRLATGTVICFDESTNSIDLHDSATGEEKKFDLAEVTVKRKPNSNYVFIM